MSELMEKESHELLEALKHFPNGWKIAQAFLIDAKGLGMKEAAAIAEIAPISYGRTLDSDPLAVFDHTCSQAKRQIAELIVSRAPPQRMEG